MSKTIGEYIKIIDSTPILSKEEELEHLNKAPISLASKEKLFHAHFLMVVGMAKRYHKSYRNYYNINLEDMIQEGLMGLETALSKFNFEKKCRFSTYAMWWVSAKIHRYMRGTQVIRLPENVSSKLNRMRDSDENLQKELDRAPTDEEIADDLEYSQSDVEQLRVILHFNQVSSVDDNDDEFYLGGVLFKTQPTEDDRNNPREACLRDDGINYLRKAINELNPLYKLIIKRRYGIDCNRSTLHEVGRELGLSFERVRQLQILAEKELRHTMNTSYEPARCCH